MKDGKTRFEMLQDKLADIAQIIYGAGHTCSKGKSPLNTFTVKENLKRARELISEVETELTKIEIDDACVVVHGIARDIQEICKQFKKKENKENGNKQRATKLTKKS